MRKISQAEDRTTSFKLFSDLASAISILSQSTGLAITVIQIYEMENQCDTMRFSQAPAACGGHIPTTPACDHSVNSENPSYPGAYYLPLASPAMVWKGHGAYPFPTPPPSAKSMDRSPSQSSSVHMIHDVRGFSIHELPLFSYGLSDPELSSSCPDTPVSTMTSGDEAWTRIRELTERYRDFRE